MLMIDYSRGLLQFVLLPLGARPRVGAGNTQLKPGRSHLLAIGLYSVVTLGLLGPVHPTEEVWGGNVSDVFNHLHIVHWQGRAAASGQLLPTHDPLLHFPDGGTVFVADPIGQTLIAPLVWLAGPVFAANALVFLSLVFACWAMFWLVGRLTGDPLAAFFAGLVFGSSPITLGHAHNGIWELLQTGWLPLFVGCLLTLFGLAKNGDEGEGRPRWTRLAAWQLATAGTWCAASLASHWYYGMYLGFLFGLLVLVHGARRGRWRVWVHAGVVAAVTTAGTLPVALSFVRSTRSELTLTRGLEAGLWGAFKVADPAFFFRSRPPEIETFLHLTYPCVVVLAVAAAGLVLGTNRRAIAGWLAAAAFFAALAAGPTPVWNDEVVGAGALGWLLPHRWFSGTVPVFDSMEFPYRFFVMVHLCLAIAVGWGLAAVPWAGWRRRSLLAGLTVLYVAELAVNSGAPVPMDRQVILPVGPAEQLGREPGEFAVFDLPIRLEARVRHQYVVNQLFHRRPVLYSNFATAPFPFTATLARRSVVTNLFRLADEPRSAPESPWSGTLAPFEPGRVQDQAWELHGCLLGDETCEAATVEELRADLQRMRDQGLTHFAVHGDLLHPRSHLPELCRSLFGPPRWDTTPVQVHVLDEVRPFDELTGD